MTPDNANDSDASNDPASNIAIGQIVLGALVGIVLGVLASHFVQGRIGTSLPKPRTTHYHYARNGMKDEEWRYQDGTLISHSIDRNLDGSFDYWAYYDHSGLATRLEEDNNFDGKPDEFWTYSNNEVTSMKKDTDFNGVPDEFCTYKFHVVQKVDIRPNGAKFTTTRELLSNGVVTEIWRGGDTNGDFQEAIVYDPMFTPIRTNILFHPLLSVPQH